MSIIDRYHTAVRCSNMRSEPDTTSSNVDVLGAVGLARKERRLSFMILRLLTGDNSASSDTIELLTTMAWSKAKQWEEPINRQGASLIARLVLDWYRDSACRACGGHGYKVMQGAPCIGDVACETCRGSKKRDFDGMFQPERLRLALWLLEEVSRETGAAGPAAMAKLAPRLYL